METVWPGVIAAAVFFLIQRLAGYVVVRKPQHPFVMLIGAVLILVGYVAVNIWAWNSYSNWQPGVFVLTSLAVGWTAIRDRWQLLTAGILKVDSTVGEGLDYRKALKLAHDSLDFMGVGATKLTRTGDEFEAAIDRCHRAHRPIRFLLLHPRSPALREWAKQAGRPEGAYAERVTESLQLLANLRSSREKNVEVRLYRDKPHFRLMFLNDQVCLLSHYVFGEGDGSQLPQLHLARKSLPGRRDVGSLYTGLRSLFEATWERAEPWDFETESLWAE